MSFDLLSEPVRRYIRDKRWEQLRPIQTAAITKILSTTHHYILASRTASGKTEAAFLPILSKVNFNEPGVKVLYISPLIALINDQFLRIEELCKHLDVTVTKWHGEASKTLKERLLKQPSGIVLITPESLEAMFVNKPYHVKQLFSSLQYVVIDEIHSFIGTDRGTQLQSILSRMQMANQKPFIIIGLSATIGDFTEAKKFTGDEANTRVLVDRAAKEINAEFRYYGSEGEELPLDLLKDLYLETKESKTLIFPNSRGRAEEVAVKLKKIAVRVKGHSNYFSHHSSVDREVREYVEYFAKNNDRQNFCISCTSTLELGIDIGTVDKVVQIDATHSIASLVQRLGRSGRRDGESSNLVLYATDEWSLLQSLACWLLYKEGFIEPLKMTEKPYDLLLHQALSITKGHSGIPLKELARQIQANFAFSQITPLETERILEHLISLDLLEQLRDEVIIGVEGEKIVNSRDFYSVFTSEENFKVINAGNTIGDIPYSPQITENENILLAARIWKIKFVDIESKRIEVVPAKDGKKPFYEGGSGSVHPKVREKMLLLLYSDETFTLLNTTGQLAINEMRQDFGAFPLQNLETDRPLKINEKKLELFTFTGTRINQTLLFLLNLAGFKSMLDDRLSVFIIESSKDDFLTRWATIQAPLDMIDDHIGKMLEIAPAIMGFSKWGVFLPMRYKVKLVREKYFDIPGALDFINRIQLKYNLNKDE